MNVEKPFNQWSERKKFLEKGNRNVQFHEREIWWTSIGINLGFEQDGKNKYFERPVLVLKKFNKNLFFGVALTSQMKRNQFHFELSEDSFVILSQIRVYSSKRLNRKMTKIGKLRFSQIKEAIQRISF